MINIDKDAAIYIAGHRGLVGSAIRRKLESEGHRNLLLKTHVELDLCEQSSVRDFFEQGKPEYVFIAAAVVGGIHANSTRPVDFLKDNLQIQTNLIESAYQTGVKKLVFLGSTCIYPRDCPQPISETSLLTAPLEPTSQWYAVAKIAGIKLCQAYREQYGFDAISLMPTNLYGPNDNFDLNSSHVLPALMRKFHAGKVSQSSSVTMWGSGTPLRDFLHVDDVADACYFLMQSYSDSDIVNIGMGEEISILELALMIKRIVGYEGEIELNKNKPDGAPRKITDVGRLHALGWKHKISLEDGLRQTYQWYLDQQH